MMTATLIWISCFNKLAHCFKYFKHTTLLSFNEFLLMELYEDSVFCFLKISPVPSAGEICRLDEAWFEY